MRKPFILSRILPSFELKSLLLAALSGILLSLPFSSGNLWIFAWVGLTPLFWSIKCKSPGEVFLLSYFTGIVFWICTIYWLVHVTLLGQSVLILYLALYFGVFGLIISKLRLAFRQTKGIKRSPSAAYDLPFDKLKESSEARVWLTILIPCSWVVLEYIRGHLFSGFGWAFLGYSQYLNLIPIQIADITGVYGVSFIIVMVNICLYDIFNLNSESKAPRKQIAILVFVIVFITNSYGIYRLLQKNQGQTLKISVIQGNIPQELKWAPSAKDFILDRYIELTKQSVLGNADLIVWPEAASPVFLGEDNVVFASIFSLAKNVKTPLLIGSVIKEGLRYFNSALLIDKNGHICARYDKLHLVPFGEYIPLKKTFPFLETIVPIGDFDAGLEYTLFDLSQARFAVLICFEDTIPELARNFTKKGAELLINITNDGWYKKTSAAYQHLSASVFRALENRVPLVRSANTGVSCFIDSNGRIISRLEKNNSDIFVEGLKTDIVILKARYSFYCRYGDIFVFGCFALLIFYGIIKRINKGKSSNLNNNL